MRRDTRLKAMQSHCSNGIIAVTAFIDRQHGHRRLNGIAKASHRPHEKNQLGELRVYTPISPDAMRQHGRLLARCRSSSNGVHGWATLTTGRGPESMACAPTD